MEKILTDQCPVDLTDLEEGLHYPTGFENAIIGVAARANQKSFLVLDRDKCISILMERDNMSREEADEFFDFNINCAYVGEHTPAFIERVAHK